MATKRTSKKVKQVANKAKKSPRTTTHPADFFSAAAIPLEQQISEAKVAVAELERRIEDSDVVEPDGSVFKDIAVTPDGFEFGVGMQPQEARTKAIERSKKVDLKNEVKSLINSFRVRMEKQLEALSDKVEAQFRPLVEAVSTIAVAQKELTHELASFQDNLNYALDLNDELEPMDIGYGADEYFGEQVSLIEPVSTIDEMLVDGIEDAAWTGIPSTEAYVGPRKAQDGVSYQTGQLRGDKPVN